MAELQELENFRSELRHLRKKLVSDELQHRIQENRYRLPSNSSQRLRNYLNPNLNGRELPLSYSNELMIFVGSGVAQYILGIILNRNLIEVQNTFSFLTDCWSFSRGEITRKDARLLFASLCTIRLFLKFNADDFSDIRNDARLLYNDENAVSSLGSNEKILLDEFMERLNYSMEDELRFHLSADVENVMALRYISQLPSDPATVRPPSLNFEVLYEPPQISKSSPPDVAPKMERHKSAPYRYQVWFGTNRKPVDSADTSQGFTNTRDVDGRVHYGVCNVVVPESHKFGSTGTNFLKRWARLRFHDDHLTLENILPFSGEDDFTQGIQDYFSACRPESRELVVYLHGFNTSFEGAAIRAAQIGFDLKITGAMAFFSWPSLNTLIGYPSDAESISASERQIADFIKMSVTQTDATRVHMIVHSMGNRGFARAISRIAEDIKRSGVAFGQIILAAPDIDVDVFKDLATVYPSISARTTMYVSSKDIALQVSSYIQNSTRAGYTPPYTVVEGIDTVEVTDVDLTIMGHGYVAEAHAVLNDIKQLLDSNKSPSTRSLVQRKEKDGMVWYFQN